MFLICISTLNFDDFSFPVILETYGFNIVWFKITSLRRFWLYINLCRSECKANTVAVLRRLVQAPPKTTSVIVYLHYLYIWGRINTQVFQTTLSFHWPRKNASVYTATSGDCRPGAFISVGSHISQRHAGQDDWPQGIQAGDEGQRMSASLAEIKCESSSDHGVANEYGCFRCTVVRGELLTCSHLKCWLRGNLALPTYGARVQQSCSWTTPANTRVCRGLRCRRE